MFMLSLDGSKQAAATEVTFKSVQQMLEEPIMPETLNQINSNEFISKTFTSSSASTKAAKKLATEKVVINLDAETITVPQHENIEAVDAVFNPTVR